MNAISVEAEVAVKVRLKGLNADVVMDGICDAICVWLTASVTSVSIVAPESPLRCAAT